MKSMQIYSRHKQKQDYSNKLWILGNKSHFKVIELTKPVPSWVLVLRYSAWWLTTFFSNLTLFNILRRLRGTNDKLWKIKFLTVFDFITLVMFILFYSQVSIQIWTFNIFELVPPIMSDVYTLYKSEADIHTFTDYKLDYNLFCLKILSHSHLLYFAT